MLNVQDLWVFPGWGMGKAVCGKLISLVLLVRYFPAFV